MSRLNTSGITKGTRASLAKPVIAVVLAAETGHMLTVLALPHPVLASNIFQLFFSLFTTAVCLQQRRFSANKLGMRRWAAMAAAFGIWTAGQAVYICSLYRPIPMLGALGLDNALWLLFGLPLLVAINITLDQWDRIQWLDRVQEVIFFMVLYVLVFSRSEHFDLNNAFLIQNLALLLCCILRLPSCTTYRERRFFFRLATFILVYGGLETIGDILSARGLQPGSPVELIWTLPMSSLVILIMRDALKSDQTYDQNHLLVTAFRRAAGLSVTGLAFLSIGVSALLAMRHPVFGGITLTCSFVLFALRTNAREAALHEAHGRLEETVLLDPLTGLGNRRHLRASLTGRLASTSAENSVLLFLDLDRFKAINDSLGHAYGDRLLIEVATRLRSSSPPNSVVCRLGGDEFVVLASTESSSEAEEIGEDLLAALRQPYELSGHVARCSASIGLVLVKHDDDVEDLLRTADHAMYRAKQLGKNRLQTFDADTMAQMSSRWQMESDLRTSIERGEVDIAYQPIMTVEGSRIAGFEALSRWNHSVRGNVPPSEFIPLAEDSGLILTLGASVLESATRQVGEWNKAWGTNLFISVNVSPRQFADPGFLDVLLGTLERTGFDPSLLHLEITETVLLVNENVVKHVLTVARSHGIHISLDDFGTGYSSLSFLLNLPVDEVKVDRSFVSDMHRDPRRREVVRTVIQLGQSLGKRVVAEGVETEQELNELVSMGCECAQGYLISRPLLPAALEADMPSIHSRNIRPLQPVHNNLLLFQPSSHTDTLWQDALPLTAAVNAN